MPNPAGRELIEVENLSFSYEEEVIFSQVDFSVRQGDFVVITGPNGSGKSTLLRMLLGELPPSSGGIRLFGQDLRRFKNWPAIAWLPQNVFSAGSAFPATVEEIVMTALFPQIGLCRFPKREHQKKVISALEQVGMADFARRRIGNLSGGQIQRVMLARALAGSSELLLLDEPTAGVDRRSSQSFFELLSRLNAATGLTVVMVTHDLAGVLDFLSRILCLENGSLMELDKKQVDEELSHRHKHPDRDNF